jgi:hypothetical protein
VSAPSYKRYKLICPITTKPQSKKKTVGKEKKIKLYSEPKHLTEICQLAKINDSLKAVVNKELNSGKKKTFAVRHTVTKIKSLNE